MCRTAEQGPWLQLAPGGRRRSVGLAEVEHIGLEIGSQLRRVIDADQPLIPRGHRPRSFERRQLRLARHPFLPDLDDVHATGKGGRQKISEVTLLGSSVGAQIEPSQSQSNVESEPNSHRPRLVDRGNT